jgi:protein tyrosine/serine phosphatase
MFYRLYDRPAAAQADDIKIINTINSLIDVLRQPQKKAVVRSIADAIEAAAYDLNHFHAETEVRAFCTSVTDVIDSDELSAIIDDYIKQAELMVKEGI